MNPFHVTFTKLIKQYSIENKKSCEDVLSEKRAVEAMSRMLVLHK